MQEAHPRCLCSSFSFFQGSSAMTKTTVLLSLIVTALASMPVHAQRVFVSGHGLDTNPCTVTQPCRTFQHVHDTAPANSEIDVLDPAGYGQLTITKGISIQAHGFGGITACTNCNAITIQVTTSDPVTLNGLLIDGGSTGFYGINITSGRSVQILNSVVRHFQVGIYDVNTTNGANLLIEDTVVSDNITGGIDIIPAASFAQVTLNRITANSNQWGIGIAGNVGSKTMIANSVLSHNTSGLDSEDGTAWLAKTVISGNDTGVNVAGGTVFSYGDNYINNNGTPVSGSLMPVSMQ
jgi:hypothetical protein